MAGLLANDDPGLPLQVNSIDTATGLNNAANLVQSDRTASLAQQLTRGDIAMQPARLQQIQAQTGLIGAQAGLAGAETANQHEALIKAQFDNMNEKSQAQAAAAIRLAAMVKPSIDSGDVNTANAIAQSAANDPLYGPAAKELLGKMGGDTTSLKGLVDAHVQAGMTLGVIPNSNVVVPQGGSVVDRQGKTVNADPGSDLFGGAGAWNAQPQGGATVPAGQAAPTTAPAQQAPAGQQGSPSTVPPPLLPQQAQPLPTPTKQGENQVSPTDQLPLTADTPQSISAKYPGLHGQAFLQTINPAIAAQVQAYSEGRLIFPTSNSERTPFMRAVVGAALQYNPGLDTTTMQTRQAMRTSMANGDFGGQVSNLNMGMSHMDTYLDAFNGTDNGSFPLENAMGNGLAKQGIGPNATALQGTFGGLQAAKNAMQGEMAVNFKASGATDQEIEKWSKSFEDDAAPATVGGALGKGTELLDGRMNSLATQYNRAMGTNITGWQLLSPEAQKAYIKVKQQVPDLLQNKLPASGAAPAGAAQGTGGWKYIGKVNQ